MNVRQFIKNIDQQLATMSESDLRAFVHDLARKSLVINVNQS